ncbi:MAG: hypothetical protein WCH99_16035 [Verrucomicrobiota bacterium]
MELKLAFPSPGGSCRISFAGKVHLFPGFCVTYPFTDACTNLLRQIAKRQPVLFGWNHMNRVNGN